MKLQDFDFRIWDVNYKGCSNKNCKCQSNFIYGEEAKIRLSEFVNKDVEIELWTGFYDKNGKKIYENDILKNDELDEFYHIARDNTYEMFEINFLEKNPEGKLIRVNGSEYLYFFKIMPSNKYSEVIGNIHENAEILKDKELLSCLY